jgi:hypothetical protein
MNTPFFSECVACKRQFRTDASLPSCPYCGTAQKPVPAPKAAAAVPSRDKGR